MVQIKQLINTGILNNEWVGFQGDSEFIDSNDELQLGYWTFKGIIEPKGIPYETNDDIDENIIIGNNSLFAIKNENGKICAVQINYTK